MLGNKDEQEESTVLQDVVARLNRDGVQFLYHEPEGRPVLISTPDQSALDRAYQLAARIVFASQQEDHQGQKPAGFMPAPEQDATGRVPCKVCGLVFIPGRKTQRICSASCRRDFVNKFKTTQRRSKPIRIQATPSFVEVPEEPSAADLEDIEEQFGTTGA